MVTVIYTTISSEVVSIDGFDISRIGGHTLMLDIFPLLLSCLCICIVCKCVAIRVLVCCFFVREHLVASFFFSGFAIGGL